MPSRRNESSKKHKKSTDDLIEINPEFLEKIMSAPIISRSNKHFLIDYFIRKGRVAYLLKSSIVSKFARRKPKEYQTKLCKLQQINAKISKFCE